MLNVFYKDDNFTISIQWVRDQAFMHVNVVKWSPSIAKKVKEVWEEVQKFLRTHNKIAVFSFIPKDEKIKKFNELHGMRELRRFREGILMVKDL